MDIANNPFMAGAGSKPPELVGRDHVLEAATTELQRVRLGRPSKGIVLVGLRGVGKTVLLNRIQELAVDQRCEVAVVEADENKKLAQLLLPPLRSMLFRLDRLHNVNDKIKQAWNALSNFARAFKFKFENIELRYDPTPGVADSGDFETDLLDLLIAVAEASSAAGTASVIIIDEMQYLDKRELSALISCIHKLIQRQMPLAIFGAGLPQIRRLAGDSKEYSERLFKFIEIGALSKEDAAAALYSPAKRQGVEFEASALDELVKITGGYPYFLQEWGTHVWNIAQCSPIQVPDVRAANVRAQSALDESFFRVRFERTTPKERRYLRAMAEIRQPAPKASDIAAILMEDARSLAMTRAALTKKGMIYSPTHGNTVFTVPLFDDYMRRTMDFETSNRNKRSNEIRDLIR